MNATGTDDERAEVAKRAARAGGRVTDLDGERWAGEGGFVASNGCERIHEGALEAARVVRED